MKHRTLLVVLAASLLACVFAVLSGCGRPNPLTSIIVSPLTPVVAKGKTYQLFVTAIFSNKLAVPAWSQVTWQTSNPLVATVSSTGLVSGIATGTAEITATDIFHPDISHTVTVFVAELLSITIDPAVASISTGTIRQFTATGVYSIETPTAWSSVWPPDLTTLVSWASSSTAVAVISNVAGFSGVATAVAAGTTAITATDLATGITGTAVLTVLP